MKTQTCFPYDIIELSDVGIFMPDGCRLSARIWMPKEAQGFKGKPMAEGFPAVLEHLPYRKRDGTIVRDQFTHPWLAGHGYVCVRTDMRGNGDSQGLMEDEYSQQELDDGLSVIDWITNQAWSNGAVGMMGISWGGFNSLQVAALAPPALKAIVTLCSTVDRYADDIHYKGGCLLGENFGWSTNMLAYSSRPPDPALLGEAQAKKLWRERLENLPLNLSTWLRHQHRDTYWEHGSVCEDYGAIKAAVLTVGGWHDGYRNTMAHLAENLDAPVKALVGPWNHKYPHYAAPGPAIGFLQEIKAWWDHYLKGEDRGCDQLPAYRAYLMDSIAPKRWFDERPGRWIAERDWPSQGIEQETLFLTADQGLSADPVKQGESFAFRVSSRQDCGAMSGEYFPFAFSDELPDEQSPDDRESLCFDGAVLEQAMDLVGAPDVRLKLSCDNRQGLIAVRLLDLQPDGSSALITYGVLNLTHARGHSSPQALIPNDDFDINLRLDQIAYAVPAGHRLRLAISNAYWPLVWPSPEAGTLKLSAGSIGLPCRPVGKGDECQFDAPEGATLWRREVLRAGSYERRCDKDPNTGHATISIDCDFGLNKDLQHGLISGGETHEIWSIDPLDPCSAKAQISWIKEGGRPDFMWRSEVEAQMTCDREKFYHQARIMVWLNETVFFERSYEDQIERNLV